MSEPQPPRAEPEEGARGDAIDGAPEREGPSGPEGPGPPRRRRLDARAAIAIFLLYVGAQLAGAAAVGLALGLLAHQSGVRADDPEALRALQQRAQAPGTLASALAGAALVGLAIRRLRGEGLRQRSRLGAGLVAGPAPHLVSGALLGVLVALLYQVAASSLLPAPPPPEELGPLTQMASTPGTPRLVVTLLALAIAPPVEEVLFRGLLFAGFARSWGPAVAAALVTALFVAVHAPELLYFPPAALSVGALALATIGLRLATGAVGPALACHLAYNGAVLLGMLGAG